MKRESREKNSFYLEHKCLEFRTPAAVNGHKENSSMSAVFCQKLDSSDVVESPFFSFTLLSYELVTVSALFYVYNKL